MIGILKRISVIFMLFLTSFCWSQARLSSIKAAYIEKIVRLIEWPGSGQKDTVRIMVLGKSPVIEALNDIAKKRMKGSPQFVIISADVNHTGFVCNPDIIFLASECKENPQIILEKYQGKPVLTISETPGYAAKGMMINFFVHDNNLLFELNPKALDLGGLKANYMLYSVSRIVTN